MAGNQRTIDFPGATRYRVSVSASVCLLICAVRWILSQANAFPSCWNRPDPQVWKLAAFLKSDQQISAYAWINTHSWSLGMPLYADAKAIVRANLLAIQAGQKVRGVPIGTLTAPQLAFINAQRSEDGLPEVVAEVLFVGAHIYKRRILKDGYEIEDVVAEIESALSEASVFIVTDYMTALQNPVPRADRLGNRVHDRAILECTRYRPNPELFSVQPKGDFIKPAKK